MGAFRRSAFFSGIWKLSIFLIGNLRALQAESFDPASFSAYAMDLSTGKVWIDCESRKSFSPSSSLKLVTTAAAFDLLGPEATFETQLAYDGAIEKGVLRGNLYILGGGDPSLASSTVPSGLALQKLLASWTKAVKDLGIVQIEGGVKGDESRWERALAVGSWFWEDLGNYFGAGASALSFHENAYSLFFRPSADVGEKASLIRTEPKMARLQLENEVTTGPEGSGDCAWIYGSERSFFQQVRGTIPAGVEEFRIRGAIPDPALVCAELFSSALEQSGVWIKGAQLPAGEKKLFHKTVSPLLSDLIYWTNQKSINLYAEHFLKKMGEVGYGKGSTQAGLQAVTSFLQKNGVDLSGWHLSDGSGLSRTNLVTAKGMVDVLAYVKKQSWFPVFFSSLPEVRKGIRAKTGSMSFSRAYAGYAGDIAFAMLINHCSDRKKMEEKIEEFFEELEAFSRQTTP